MNEKKLLQRLEAGHKNNVKYKDFLDLIKHMGFVYSHTTGDHDFYKHPKSTFEQLDLQNKDGEAKPYQISQFLRMKEDLHLKLD
jgi:hypothetical protein